MQKMSLNQAIIKSGFKKSFIASQLSISKTRLSLWIRKPSSIKIENALKICQLIDTPIDLIDFSANAEISKK